MCGDENGGNIHVLSTQPGNRLQSIHAWQIMIDDKAAAVRGMPVVQQLLAVGISANGKSLDF